MSGKSKLKTDVLRGEPFASAALHLVDDVTALVPPVSRAAVRVVVEDASVRYAAGPGKSTTATGASLLETFWRPVQQAFASLPNLHTYIVLFDKKRWVPEEKADTQEDRREALAASSRRHDVDEWKWDGASDIIVRAQLLPPWSRLRLDGKAYARALNDLAALMAESFVPPPSKRIIIDWQNAADAPLVLESDANGTVMQAYHNVAFANTIGEADMAAQWYAKLARMGHLTATGRPNPTMEMEDDIECDDNVQLDGLTVQRDDSSKAHHQLQPRGMPAELQAKYYSNRVPIAAAPLRDVYEAGDVVLRSTDTDYFPLSMLHYVLCTAASANTYNVWLAIGICHVGLGFNGDNNVALSTTNPKKVPKFCTKTTAGAVAKSEVYSVRDLCRAVHGLHPAETSLHDAITSFVVFCTACGNDYIKRRYGITHVVMFDAYRRHQLRAEWIDCVAGPSIALVCPTSYMTFLRQCYWERLAPKHRPMGAAAMVQAGPHERWTWLAQLVQDAYGRPEAHMPTLQEVVDNYNSLVWAVAYACTGPHGYEFVPRRRLCM